MNNGVSDLKINETINELAATLNSSSKTIAAKGIKHAGSLWRKEDGSEDEFKLFCIKYFVSDSSEKAEVFNKACKNFESLFGHFSQLSLELRENIDLDRGPLHYIDEMFGSYSVGAHFSDDFFSNKIAFIIALNFPYYSLTEKNELGKNWSAKDWAYARLGDFFINRIPAELQQKATAVSSKAGLYVSEYNIYMGKITTDNDKQLFPIDMVLLSHWNLRDELKSNYGNKEDGIEKQKTIYEIMKRIIAQEIPQKVINCGEYFWNPFSNKTFKDGREVSLTAEADTRYQHILNNFHAMKAIDSYTPEMNTYIMRTFAGEMEIPQIEVENIFDEYLRAPLLKKLAELIKQRLGRDLLAYDIWYDGFKARSSISEEKLNAITQKLYPNTAAYEKDMAKTLEKLGFAQENAQNISSFIAVDAARGSGHAWGAQMRTAKAHLRTRIGAAGMSYKGYNIATHEFGHNVEQTISLHQTPYYTLNGVPNTAFTEALAFLFQKRDLEILGINNSDKQVDNFKILDICWHTFEMMGVSMVDMGIWKWMYENPQATPTQLKTQTINIAKNIWNKYFSAIYGSKDEPILAIYSHMINSPLYLSNYSFGSLIEFQLGQYLKGKDFGKEVERIWSLGRLTPRHWMQKAVGQDLLSKPLLEAAEEALKNI